MGDLNVKEENLIENEVKVINVSEKTRGPRRERIGGQSLFHPLQIHIRTISKIIFHSFF